MAGEGREKGGEMGQWLFTASDFSCFLLPESFSKTSTGVSKAWGQSSFQGLSS